MNIGITGLTCVAAPKQNGGGDMIEERQHAVQ